MQYDCVIIGSGPNGLAAAVVAVRAGLRVAVIEANDTFGGGARTLEQPNGELYDWGSAVHPMALASPFFQEFQLSVRKNFYVPEMSYAHVLSENQNVYAWRNIEQTATELGPDEKAWLKLFQPLMLHTDATLDFVSDSPILALKHFQAARRFAWRMLKTGAFQKLVFNTPEARALLTGVFAHAVGKQPSIATAAPGLILATLAHTTGWPIPQGGSQAITDAMIAEITAHGGEFISRLPVTSLEQIPESKIRIFDTSVKSVIEILQEQLPKGYLKRLKNFRHAPGVSKVDFTLSEPIPWSDSNLLKTGTVHFGGTAPEITASEKATMSGHIPEKPYFLLSQPSLFDSTRTHDTRHTVWAYMHVPAFSEFDATELITAEIEKVAPGFRATILSSSSTTAQQIYDQNQNMVGGDLGIGQLNLKQLLARPVLSPKPWRIPVNGKQETANYICSGATPPGPGVHGMGGLKAMETALEDVYGMQLPPLSFQ